MYQINFKHPVSVHFIGIGGISMSGLAAVLLKEGFRISGSDAKKSPLTKWLEDKGAVIHYRQSAHNIDSSQDVVVYTAAIHPDNPEFIAAREKQIPMLTRAELLGQIMKNYEMPIAVSGTHGKTTTTSMLSHICLAADLDPTISVGGILKAIDGNIRVGNSQTFITEACEYTNSFLSLHPKIALILNIDADHLDCYKDIDEIEETFAEFFSFVPQTGTVVGNGDDPRVLRQLRRLKCSVITFGKGQENAWRPVNLTEDSLGRGSFDLSFRGSIRARVSMNVPGDFNVMNALAAIAAADVLGVDAENSAEIIGRFHGAHRRFELTDTIDGVEIFHDYGHNPAEMRNAVSIARKRCRGKLWAVMQPHTFSRVRTLFNDYLTCTAEADHTLVTDICAAREADPGDLNSGMLVEGMKKHGVDAVWTPSFDDTEKFLKEHWAPGDLVLTMGCGDINLLNDQIHRHFAQGVE